MAQLEDMENIKLLILNNLAESSSTSSNENINARWNRISHIFKRNLYVLNLYYIIYDKTCLLALLLVH